MICSVERQRGGIIALALASGKTAKQVVEFYKTWGSEIFPDPHPLQVPALLWHRFFGRKYLYENTALRRASVETFQTATIGDSNSYLCIPAYNTANGNPRVFKTDHGEGLNRDDDLLMSEIAIATSAAPTYFPVAAVQEKHGKVGYLDGGLWANNPTLVGLIEASRFFVGSGKPYQQAAILSVGNASSPAGWLGRSHYLSNPISHIQNLLDATGSAQQLSMHHHLTFLQDAMAFPMVYHRVAGMLSPEQQKGISLDKANKKSIDTLLNLGVEAAHRDKLEPRIRSFFTECAAPRMRRNSIV